ncbi:hypothetical protein [Lichenibacterium dinghuense]|uniref:hypothetical protein n=1 Tax=Lichenibacterium dinghuense TaxID=2895977 RepID=UPI001F1A385B|nr:hypothetical protein [Lichenibacterium sp. 6Y81]
MSSEDAKRAFAKVTDEINRRSQTEGPGADAASDLAEILAEHERECAALTRALAEAGPEGAAR